MANIYEGAVEVSRRTMTLFFVVDASGSMDGSKMGTLNPPLRRLFPKYEKYPAKMPTRQSKSLCWNFQAVQDGSRLRRWTRRTLHGAF